MLLMQISSYAFPYSYCWFFFPVSFDFELLSHLYNVCVKHWHHETGGTGIFATLTWLYAEVYKLTKYISFPVTPWCFHKLKSPFATCTCPLSLFYLIYRFSLLFFPHYCVFLSRWAYSDIAKKYWQYSDIAKNNIFSYRLF